MTISAINPTMSYTSPNFKGAPKLNTANIQKVAEVATEATEKAPGAIKRFRNAWNAKLNEVIEKGITKPILAPIMNSKFIENFAEKTKNIDNMACHMTTAGSIVTTATYAGTSLKTLRKDEEQKKRAKTLVLNQVMVTGLSTLGAYTINDKLGKMSKQLGYKFREANQGNPNLSKYMKGFDIAKGLLIFSIMYRYVAPVVVTPLASKIGNYIFGKDEKKSAEQPKQAQATVVPMQVAKDFSARA